MTIRYAATFNPHPGSHQRTHVELVECPLSPALGRSTSSGILQSVDYWTEFTKKAGINDPTLRKVVLAISAIPYGRPSALSAAGVVSEWRGTCSTKHLLLLALVDQRWSSLDPVLMHRVYTLTKSEAVETWGVGVAERVPNNGLVDVHTYMTATISGRPTTIDVTFPADQWDGQSSMPIWAQSGEDVEAGLDPLGSKADLVSRWCDPNVREPLIAALAANYR